MENEQVFDIAFDKVIEKIERVEDKEIKSELKKIYSLCGHTRYEAAKQLELKKVPCIVATDLTPKQVREYRLVDNKTSELSWWDFDKLNEEIEKYNLDVFDYGFKDFNLEEDYNEQNTKDSEIDQDKLQEEFKNECPKCGFKF